jgi:hypothetical protein
VDYFDILKKAWKITWKYKALWVLGLFAGTGSGGSSGGSSYQTSSGDFSGQGADAFVSAERWFVDNLVLLAVVAGLLVVIGIVFFVLSIAAQAGLVHGANEAAEDRKPSLREAWSVGFGKWGRTFMIGFMLGVPIVIAVVLMFVVIFGAAFGGAAVGDEAGAGIALGGICLLLPLSLVLLIAGVVMIGILYPLALRYGVLDDVTFGKAIKAAWGDMWGKKGAWIFWLVMLLPGFAFGIVSLLFMLPFFVPAIFLFLDEKFLVAFALIIVGSFVLMLPGAVYGTFVSSAWTIFYRRMHGREAAAAPPPVGYGTASAPAYNAGLTPPPPPLPSTPPMPEAPSMPPMPPAPPVAPTAPVVPESPAPVAPEAPAAPEPAAPPAPPEPPADA